MDRQKCLSEYADIISANKSDSAVWCTLALIVLEVCIEFFSNGKLDFSTDEQKVKKDVESAPASATVEPTSQQPQPNAEPIATPSQPADKAQNAETPQKKTDSSSSTDEWLCADNVSSQIRANRFAAATFIYAFVLWAYISLVRGEIWMKKPIDDICKQFVTAEPNTKSLVVSSIVFVCASVAFLRTVVDCILARWNTTITYDTDGPGLFFWMPCMPFVLVFAALFSVFEGVKVVAAWLTGDSEVSSWTQGKGKGKAKATEQEGVELQEEQDEERRGLVANVDGYDGEEHHDDQEGLPAYDDVFTESKAHGDSGKMQEV